MIIILTVVRATKLVSLTGWQNLRSSINNEIVESRHTLDKRVKSLLQKKRRETRGAGFSNARINTVSVTHGSTHTLPVSAIGLD